MTKKPRPRRPPLILTSSLLMQVWTEAAARLRQLGSDCAYAACASARADWYRHVYGAVPPLPPREESEA